MGLRSPYVAGEHMMAQRTIVVNTKRLSPTATNRVIAATEDASVHFDALPPTYQADEPGGNELGTLKLSA